MKDDVVSVSGKTFETYSWQVDQMDIVRHIILELDNQRIHEIADHFKCDLSEIREWLDRKNKPQTNADRIRSMTDEELAQVVRNPCDIVDHYPAGWCKERNCGYKCALEWLKQEAER